MSQTRNRTIAVIGGTGNEGRGLALRWAAAGYRIIIGSRSQEKAETVAAELNQKLEQEIVAGNANRGAADRAEVVVLSVPYDSQLTILEDIKPALEGKVLVNVSVPLKPPKVSVAYVPPGGSATKESQDFLGEGVRVVAAFQNVAAAHLEDPDHVVDCDVLVCGNDKEAKQIAIELAAAAGMRGFDAGPLENAVVVEGLTPVLIGLNMRYKAAHAGIRITGID